MSANVLASSFDGPSWLARITRKQRAAAEPRTLDAEPRDADLILSDLTISTAVMTAADADLSDVAATTALSLAHGATMLTRQVITNEPLPEGAWQVILRGFAQEPATITLTVNVVATEARSDEQQQVELSTRIVVATETPEAAQALTTALLASVPHHVEKPLVVSRSPRVSAGNDTTTTNRSANRRTRWTRWRSRP